jgi:hypothetical protein
LLRKKTPIPTSNRDDIRQTAEKAPSVWLEGSIGKKSKNQFDPGQKQLYKNTVHFRSTLSSPENTMASQAMKITLERIALFQFTPAHCAQARAMLGWGVQELSAEAGVSVDAIQRFEAEKDVLDVTRLALAYRFESEGLVFFPGFAPGRGMNVKGTTPNPVGRADFAMVE